MQVRGIKNHNPLNIRKTKDKWVGLDKSQTDPSFFVFVDDVYCFRAGFRIIRSYIKIYPDMTLAQMVARWAPPKENDTKYYTRFLSNCLGVPDSIILGRYLDDVAFMSNLLRCMAKMEVGHWYDESIVRQAWYMERGIINP